MTRIGIAIFDGAEELDWAGPWEVLAAWAKQWPDDGVEVFTVAQRDGVVTCAKGLRILPDRTWADAGNLDVLVYPGGRGTRRELKDGAVLDWLRERDLALRTVAPILASVIAPASSVAIAQVQPERAVLAQDPAHFAEDLDHLGDVFLGGFLQAELVVDLVRAA